MNQQTSRNGEAIVTVSKRSEGVQRVSVQIDDVMISIQAPLGTSNHPRHFWPDLIHCA
jgi:hypothetical protein